ncbi:MAG: HYR domain-containing protein, partial [Thermoanaerobaculia bacterium]
MSRLCVCLAISFLLLPGAAFGALTGLEPITAEATGPGGASVGFTAQVEGGNDGSDGRPADTVTCTPSSGSIFPIGTTTVSCAGSEGSTGTLLVTVVDTTAPALSLPLDFAVVTTSPSGEAVTYTATAFDLVDGSVAITCAPPSGSTFPLGTTAVPCTASDSTGNTASGGFNITVATEPPPPGNPDLIAEATGPDGARVMFNTGDTEDDDGRPGSGGCSPAPGSTFPLGETTVTCPSGNFTLAVVDTTPPELSLPEDITTTAVGPSGAAVTYTATATDLVDGSIAVTCTPPSGSTFAVGTTTVNCSATDAHDNTATGSFQVVVTPDPTAPPDITAEATGPGGAVVTFAVPACVPASGSTFPLGETEVNCDAGGTFTVTVVDTTPPELTLPAGLTVEATSSAGAVVSFSATAVDLVDGAVSVLCTPPSGSTFAFGTTTVECTAADAQENGSRGTFSITVVD